MKSREQKNADRRARYARYKAAGRCVQCQAMLIEGEAGVRCVECDERMIEARTRFEERNPGRKRNPGPYKSIPKYLAKRRETYLERKIAGRCVTSGCRDLADDSSVHCAKHHEAINRASREYERRQAAARRAA